MTRFIYLFLSVFLVLSGVTQANAASSWSVSSSVSAGSRSVVTATKAGFKSAVNVAPTAGRLALKLGKGANWAALLYAAVQLAPDLADIKSFQPNYVNNRVDYVIPATTNVLYKIGSFSNSDPEVACRAYQAANGSEYVSTVYQYGNTYSCNRRLSTGAVVGTLFHSVNETISSKNEYITIPAAAAQMIKNADAGHADSRAATRETATEMVIGGQFDQDLLAGAVPTNDTRPLVPSVPISGNGNVAPGVGVGTGDDGLMTGGDLGKAADDARVAADNARKAAQAAKDAATAAANDARVAADNANDLVNSAVDQAIKDAAQATADAAAQAAKDAAAVSDAAVKAANDRAAAAERAAEAAASAAKDAAAQAAKDLDAAKAAGDAAAIAAAEKAKAAADAALADAKAKQEAAEKAAEKAKAEAAKPFELPAFCSWASKVCDLADWVMKDDPLPPDIPIPEQTMEVKDPEVFDKSYINVSAECPSDIQKSIPIGTNSFSLVIPMAPVCDFGSTVIKPVIIFIAFIQAALMIGTVFKVG